jgi:DNA recombination protein RmuC
MMNTPSAYLIYILLAIIIVLILMALSRLRNWAATQEKEKTGFVILEKGQERLEKALREEIAVIRKESREQGRQDRTEQQESIKAFGSGVEKKLEETLSRVRDQMNVISKGLGEMNQVASSVSDLKRVMTAITSRGAWGEARLEAILEDALTPSQYLKNAQLADGTDRVEFAILLPGGAEGSAVHLPVDSKFPMESYQTLGLAQEKGDKKAADEAAKALEADVKKQAKKIQKYVNPPLTTDFALMFLPAEGLYLEALRRPGLLDLVRRENKVAIVGPSTVTAFLMSLRMGFTTLAIQTKSREVWEILAVIRKEFERFAERLDKARERLDQADVALGEVSITVQKMDRKLRQIEFPTGAGEGGDPPEVL